MCPHFFKTAKNKVGFMMYLKRKVSFTAENIKLHKEGHVKKDTAAC